LLSLFLYAATAFFSIFSITIVIAYQQIIFQEEKRQQVLVHELNQVKDRFRNILYSDITAANSLAIFYRKYGLTNDFDEIAPQIIKYNKYAEVLQLNINGVVKKVYPLDGYEQTIGLNTYLDSIRLLESKRALQKNSIYFAGPRNLREGGVGILGKVPIQKGKDTLAVCVVLTRLNTILKALDLDAGSDNPFSYWLIKKTDTKDTARYFLSKRHPYDITEAVYADIPEGDWNLGAAYSVKNAIPKSSLIIITLGTLLSLLSAILIYKISSQPFKLERIIEKKTLEIQQMNNSLEAKVIERTKQLVDANNELESFSYTVSHDLRAPLRSINGYASIVEKRYSANMDEDGKMFIQSILQNTIHMGHLIDDLLDLSRLGRKELSTNNVDMNTLVNEIIEDYEFNKKDNLKIKISKLLPAKCDASLIKQVWINLISNAVKYSQYKPEQIIDIGSNEKNGVVEYYIKDNGTGFDMQLYDKLFGVFQRLHTSEKFEGTGIGLATVQKIIRKHGQTIWAESILNEGSTFYFTLPKTTDNSLNIKASPIIL